MIKNYYSVGIIVLLIIEAIAGYIVQREYADIMGTSNITYVYILAIIINILVFSKVNKTAQAIKLLSVLLLIFSPLYFYINKPEYSVDNASQIVAEKFDDKVTYRHGQIHEDKKVYVFFSEHNSNFYYFNPYNGETGVLDK